MTDAEAAEMLRRLMEHEADYWPLIPCRAALMRAIEVLEREPTDPFDDEQTAIDRIVKTVYSPDRYDR